MQFLGVDAKKKTGSLLLDDTKEKRGLKAKPEADTHEMGQKHEYKGPGLFVLLLEKKNVSNQPANERTNERKRQEETLRLTVGRSLLFSFIKILQKCIFMYIHKKIK